MFGAITNRIVTNSGHLNDRLSQEVNISRNKDKRIDHKVQGFIKGKFAII